MNTAPKQFTRVMVVDDSPVTRQVLTALINSDPNLRVVGTASNGQEAVQMVPRLRPDVITLDANMPVMDGFEATKQIMAFCPTPILMVSSTVFKGGMDMVFQAMRYGALDVIDKTPFRVGNDSEKETTSLRERIKTLARVRVITHPLAKLPSRLPRKGAPDTARSTPGSQIIAIASSTGGPQALMTLLKSLPKDLPCGIAIVQHISDGFDRGLAQWLEAECELTVQIADDGAVIQSGHVYVAPTGLQMRVASGGRIQLTDEAPCEGQKPSGTILFQSVAQSYGDRAIGVILTGMGRDGADGLKQLKAARGRVIAQDESTSIVFGMPKAAIELGVVDWVQPLDQISGAILRAVGYVRSKEATR